MTTTTIQIEAAARDRLRILAAERGTTIGGLVSEFAYTQLTTDELKARGERVAAYIKANLSPDFDTDTDAKRRVKTFMDEVRAGRDPKEL
jgi:hypothetical protein